MGTPPRFRPIHHAAFRILPMVLLPRVSTKCSSRKKPISTGKDFWIRIWKCRDRSTVNVFLRRTCSGISGLHRTVSSYTVGELALLFSSAIPTLNNSGSVSDKRTSKTLWTTVTSGEIEQIPSASSTEFSVGFSTPRALFRIFWIVVWRNHRRPTWLFCISSSRASQTPLPFVSSSDWRSWQFLTICIGENIFYWAIVIVVSMAAI